MSGRTELLHSPIRPHRVRVISLSFRRVLLSCLTVATIDKSRHPPAHTDKGARIQLHLDAVLARCGLHHVLHEVQLEIGTDLVCQSSSRANALRRVQVELLGCPHRIHLLLHDPRLGLRLGGALQRTRGAHGDAGTYTHAFAFSYEYRQRNVRAGYAPFETFEGRTAACECCRTTRLPLSSPPGMVVREAGVQGVPSPPRHTCGFSCWGCRPRRLDTPLFRRAPPRVLGQDGRQNVP